MGGQKVESLLTGAQVVVRVVDDGSLVRGDIRLVVVDDTVLLTLLPKTSAPRELVMPGDENELVMEPLLGEILRVGGEMVVKHEVLVSVARLCLLNGGLVVVSVVH